MKTQKPSVTNTNGSALIITVMIIAVLCLIAGSLLSYTSSKQSGPFQAASWHEAGAAAEGGVEIALNAIRRSITDGSTAWDGWQADPTYGATAIKYITQTDLLSHSGEGNAGTNGMVKAIVEITQPTGAGTINPPTISNNRYSFLIRSTGFANVPGPTRLSVNEADTVLRKLASRLDFRTGTAVTTPQVSRVVEAVASPVTPFPAAIMATDTIEIKGGANMIVDSYDPMQVPYKYDITKAYGDVTQPGNKRNNGNICTNAKKKDNTDVIRLENVSVYGLAAKGAGVVNIKTPGASVSGEIIDGFYRSLKPVMDPSKMAGFNAPANTDLAAADRPGTHGKAKVVVIQCGKGATGSAGPETLYYKFSKIHLHKDEILDIKPGAAGVGNVNGSAEIWDTGDLIIHNQGLIHVEQGARVTIYCAKNITLQEKDLGHPAIDNDATMAKNSLTYGVTGASSSAAPDPSALQFYGVVPDHHKKHVKIKTNMAGVVYAPDHDFEVNMKNDNNVNNRRHVYGSLVGRKFEIKGGTQINYDETLQDIGKPFDYTLETWQEDWYDPSVRLH